MNAHAKIVPAVVSPPYWDDTFGWSEHQAALLKARRFDEVDWDMVIDEIECVGKRERRVLESALRVVLIHQLKWQHQETFRSKSWRLSIAEHYRRFEEQLAENPSLKPQLDEILIYSYGSARREAAIETGLSIDLFPEAPPSWDEIRASRDA